MRLSESAGLEFKMRHHTEYSGRGQMVRPYSDFKVNAHVFISYRKEKSPMTSLQ